MVSISYVKIVSGIQANPYFYFDYESLYDFMLAVTNGMH